MGTNAIICVENKTNVYLYKHYDGYPSSTLPWLKYFNESYPITGDPDYKFAQLIRSSVIMAKQFNLDPSQETGWGIVDEDCGYCYKYELKEDGTIIYNQ
jgi:hypothetical protein